MEKPKKQMKIIGRTEAAQRLGMTPQALSCHVSRRNWPDGIPAPIKIGGCYKWVDEQITEFIEEKLNKVQMGLNKERHKPGRPKKKRSASCS